MLSKVPISSIILAAALITVLIFASCSDNPPYYPENLINEPANPTPGEDAVDQPIDVVLVWGHEQFEAVSNYTYDVYLGTDNIPELVSKNQENRYYQPPDDLIYNKTYCWKITAFDNNGNEIEGPLWKFSTAGLSGLTIIGVYPGEFDVPVDAVIEDFCITDNYAYLTSSGCFSGLLQVLDVSDPSAPMLMASTSVSFQAGLIHVAGNFAYVSSSSIYFYCVSIYDISNPLNPALKGTYSLIPMGISSISVSGSFMYLSVCNPGVWDGYLHIVDISDPTNPVKKSDCSVEGGYGEITVSGDYAYIATGSGLQIFNVSDPENPLYESTCPTPEYKQSIYILDNYAYLSGDDVTIIDISDPSDPFIAGEYEVSRRVDDIYVSGYYAYLSYNDEDDNGIIEVVNINNPSNPISVTKQNLSYKYARGISVRQDYFIYTTAGGHQDYADRFLILRPNQQ